MAEFNVAKYYNLTQKSYFDKLGKVSKIVGLTIESIGPDAKLNDLCVIHSADNEMLMSSPVAPSNTGVAIGTPRCRLEIISSFSGSLNGTISFLYCLSP